MSSVLMVLTNSVDGHDAEFNNWYDTEHLQEVLALPGFTAARRFRLSDGQLTAEQTQVCAHRYAAIYELDIEPGEAFAVLMEEVATGRMVLPEYIDQTSIATWGFDQIAALSATTQTTSA